ncbi:hypothetical protein CEXT_378011 [Caerostris extrusa]|uniref:RNase H type-1 domain-containing protein n=1 Tax=Caerostris extrusa TaxID=172846 RepID=A0AAV4NKG0_CAEEX|nr:hypothetical protein CEXT_378011 [Caerostris extrusa]
MGPSHVRLRGNAEADSLANSVAIELMTDHHALTFSEIFTLRKIAANKQWAITTGNSERNLELLLLLKATDKCRLHSLALLLVIFDANFSTIKSKFSLLFPNTGLTVPLPNTFGTVWLQQANPHGFFDLLDVHRLMELV